MSRFDTVVGNMGVTLLMGNLGQSITWHPPSAQGDSVALTAIVGPERTEYEIAESGPRKRVRTRDFTVTVDPDDAAHAGVADPAAPGEFEFAGERWVIFNGEGDQAIRKSANLVKCRCVRRAVAEMARSDYRDG